MKSKIFTLLAFLFSFTLFGQSLEDGLVAKYDFSQADFQNEKFVDLTANDNQITCHEIGFFDDDRGGNSLQAVAVGFPLETTFMELNEENNRSSINDLGSFSVAFWTTRTGFGEGAEFNPILNIEDENGTAYNLEIDNVNNTFRLANMTNNNTITSALAITAYPLGEWHHVAMTVDLVENKMSIYFDGQKEGESEVAVLQAPSSPVITFGKYRNGNFTDFPTCFDNLYIHNRVLSDQEVLETMNETFTSVENNILAPEELSIFPNPVGTSNYLNITFTGMTSKTLVDIIDAQGRLMKTEKVDNGQINVAQLSGGIYFLKIKTEEGSFTRKILVD